jgi:hypothetical protein
MELIGMSATIADMVQSLDEATPQTGDEPDVALADATEEQLDGLFAALAEDGPGGPR